MKLEKNGSTILIQALQVKVPSYEYRLNKDFMKLWNMLSSYFEYTSLRLNDQIIVILVKVLSSTNKNTDDLFGFERVNYILDKFQSLFEFDFIITHDYIENILRKEIIDYRFFNVKNYTNEIVLLRSVLSSSTFILGKSKEGVSITLETTSERESEIFEILQDSKTSYIRTKRDSKILSVMGIHGNLGKNEKYNNFIELAPEVIHS